MAHNPSWEGKGRCTFNCINISYRHLQMNPFILCLFVEIEWLLRACFVTFMRREGCLCVRSSKIFTGNCSHSPHIDHISVGKPAD